MTIVQLVWTLNIMGMITWISLTEVIYSAMKRKEETLALLKGKSPQKYTVAFIVENF